VLTPELPRTSVAGSEDRGEAGEGAGVTRSRVVIARHRLLPTRAVVEHGAPVQPVARDREHPAIGLGVERAERPVPSRPRLDERPHRVRPDLRHPTGSDDGELGVDEWRR
jgi:hypothetical protein